jgi:hypothetical protein
MKLIASILTTLAAFWPAILTAQTTNLLVNGDFENEPNWHNGVSQDNWYTALTANQIPGWTIEPGHAVTIHQCCNYPVISGTYSVNTDGEGWNGHNANFYQDFATVAGATCTLAFDWQGWYVNGMVTNSPELDVSVADTATGEVLFEGFYSFDTAAAHHVVTNFLGSGNALRLRIQENPESHVNDNEFIVDNFSVTGLAAPGAPTLAVTSTATNTVVVSWPLPATGWLLHATANLVTTGSVWTEIPPPYPTNGTSLYFVEPMPSGNRFYRLHKP